MGPAILALTGIISYPNPGHSVIPSICRATYDRRLLPGESVEEVLAAIHARSELADIRLNATIGVGEYASHTGYTFTQEQFFPAWEVNEDDAFVQTTLTALHRSGIEAETGAYRFCTNAAYSAGVAGIPSSGSNT